MNCKHEEKADSTSKIALFVSVLAFITSTYLSYMAYEHSRLSVSPYLDISYFFGGKGLNSGIRVDNPGLGPAIIQTLKIEWKENGETEKSDDWSLIYPKLGITNPNRQVAISTFKSGNALKSGRETLTLLGVEINTSESFALEQAIKNGSLEVSLCYRSLYNEYKISTLQKGVKNVKRC